MDGGLCGGGGVEMWSGWRFGGGAGEMGWEMHRCQPSRFRQHMSRLVC